MKQHYLRLLIWQLRYVSLTMAFKRITHQRSMTHVPIHKVTAASYAAHGCIKPDLLLYSVLKSSDCTEDGVNGKDMYSVRCA